MFVKGWGSCGSCTDEGKFGSVAKAWLVGGGVDVESTVGWPKF